MRLLALVVLVALAVTGIVIIVIRRLSRVQALASSYRLADAVLTPAERSFLGVLDLAVSDHRVLAKVRIADVIEVESSDASERARAFNRISAKHFDFLLCAPTTLAPALAIELDDGSHASSRRQERDAQVNAICRDVGLPMLRVPVRSTYSVEELRVQVANALRRDERVERQVEIVPHARADSAVTAIGARQPAAPSCPDCQEPMVLRRASRGTRTGEEFWGCGQYPRCRGIRPIDDIAGVRNSRDDRSGTS